MSKIKKSKNNKPSQRKLKKIRLKIKNKNKNRLKSHRTRKMINKREILSQKGLKIGDHLRNCIAWRTLWEVQVRSRNLLILISLRISSLEIERESMRGLKVRRKSKCSAQRSVWERKERIFERGGKENCKKVWRTNKKLRKSLHRLKKHSKKWPQNRENLKARARKKHLLKRSKIKKSKRNHKIINLQKSLKSK